MTLYTSLSRPRRAFRFVILVTAVTVGALSVQVFDASETAAATSTVTVTMTDAPPKYVPESLRIAVGTTVEWKNTAQSLHDVSTVVGDAQNKKDVHLPSGAKPFDSGFLTPGQSWKHRFTVPGHYTYFCVPHEKDGMVGHIDVAG